MERARAEDRRHQDHEAREGRPGGKAQAHHGAVCRVGPAGLKRHGGGGAHAVPTVARDRRAPPPPDTTTSGGPIAFLRGTNPSNREATIRYSLLRSVTADVQVFDLSGRRMDHPLAAAQQQAGPHALSLNTGLYPAGCHFVRLAADGAADTHKMLVVQ